VQGPPPPPSAIQPSTSQPPTKPAAELIQELEEIASARNIANFFACAGDYSKPRPGWPDYWLRMFRDILGICEDDPDPSREQREELKRYLRAGEAFKALLAGGTKAAPMTLVGEIAPATPATAAASPQPKRRRGRHAKLTNEFRRETIQRVWWTGKRGLAYCKALRDAKLSTPLEWQKEGCLASYVDAFNHPEPDDAKKWQKRIRDEMHNCTKQLHEAPGVRIPEA
jgi:hypothetical protein